LEKPAEIRLIDTSEIGSEFDDLWSRYIDEDDRLISYRTAETLRWHFAGQKAKVVCYHSCGKLTGYAVVSRDITPTLGLERTKIVDLLVEKNDHLIVGRLLKAAYSYAIDDGSHVLEVMGFPQSIREVFLKSRPYSRMAPNLPYLYRAQDNTIQEELQGADAWYACPFDGDASL
jgi:hypothetical protein